ncbi:MAG: PAS domain S-box protein [Sphingomonadales bacterium]|nr:PAS domain S-box protein [Sphingomonadales bacterium]
MARFDHEERRLPTPLTQGDAALLAAIVQSARDAIIGLDLHGTVLSWNESAAQLFGYSSSDMIGRPISRIIPYDRRREQERLLDRVGEGSHVDAFETLHLDASGHEIGVTVTASPVRDHAGALVAASLFVRETAHARSKAGSRWPHAITPRALGRNILVVEDEALIGLGLAAMLENAGFDVIGPASNLRTAMALLDRHDCALAILDINLGRGETSAPLAQRLKDDGIPFFVTSGYLAERHPAIFDEVPTFAKPVRSRSLVAAVQEVLG